MRLFGKRGPAPIGVDISDRSMEAVQLGMANQTVELLGWSRAVLPTGLRVKGDILEKEKLVLALRKLFSEPAFGQFEGDQVIVNAAEENVFSRVFEFSPPIAKNIEDNLLAAVADVMPVDLGSLAWDWQETFRSKIKQEIFWAGIRREQVLGIKEVIELAGKELVALDLESASLARALVADLAEKTGVLLLDIGSETTLIAIHDQFGIRSSYNVAIGGVFFTKEIARQLNISLKEAEVKKRKLGFTTAAEGGQLLSILQAAIQPIVEDVHRSIDSYQRKTDNKINKIILTGGSGLIPNIDFYLSQLLQLEVEMGKPSIEISPPLSANLPVLLPIALGLGLRGLTGQEGINLLNRI